MPTLIATEALTQYVTWHGGCVEPVEMGGEGNDPPAKKEERGAGHTILIGDVRGIDTIDHQQRLAVLSINVFVVVWLLSVVRRCEQREEEDERWKCLAMVAPRCCENDEQRREGTVNGGGAGIGYSF